MVKMTNYHWNLIVAIVLFVLGINTEQAIVQIVIILLAVIFAILSLRGWIAAVKKKKRRK